MTSDKRTIFVAVHESANGPNSDLSSCLLDDHYVDVKQAARHPSAIININATKLTQCFKYECGFDGGRYVKLLPVEGKVARFPLRKFVASAVIWLLGGVFLGPTRATAEEDMNTALRVYECMTPPILTIVKSRRSFS